MRKSASQIIHELETRIARLERQSSSIRKAYRDSIEDNFNPDKSVISFALSFDILSWQDDPSGKDMDEPEILEAEKKALRIFNRILGVKAEVYDRNGIGTPHAYFRIKSLKSLVDLVKKINRLKRKYGTGEVMGVSLGDFYFASGFTLIPEGLGESWPDECYQLDAYPASEYRDLEEELRESGLL